MHRLICSSSLRQLLILETPALLLSLLIAETFYKFGSFTLECLAFLPTWYAISLLTDVLATRTGVYSKLDITSGGNRHG